MAYQSAKTSSESIFLLLMVVEIFNRFIPTNAVAAMNYNRNERANFTEPCLEMAERRDCSVFNKCCDAKCDLHLSATMMRKRNTQKRSEFSGRSTEKSAFCMAFTGQIEQAMCTCTPPSNAEFSVATSSATGRFKGLLTTWWNSPKPLISELVPGSKSTAIVADAYRFRRVDFVGSVLLLFIIDLFLLSLTL